MTSLIFGATYLLHQGVVKHRHDKQRSKNYERWEGLRDEYDAQRKLSQETRRSLDAQGTGYGHDEDRPILTLRDQQEANDARTSWRPQEYFDGDQGRGVIEQITGMGYGYQYGEFQRASQLHAQATGMQASQQQYAPPTRPSMVPRRTSSLRDPRHDASVTPARLRSQKTGAVWDEGLPPPLRVQRKQYDQDSASRSASRSPALPNNSPPPENTIPTSSLLSSSSLSEAERSRLIDRQARALAAIQAEHRARHSVCGSSPCEQSRSSSRQPSGVPSRTESPSSVNTNNPFERDAQLAKSMASKSVGEINTNNPFERPSRNDVIPSNNPFERVSVPAPAVEINTNNPFERDAMFASQVSTQSTFNHIVPGGRMAELIEQGY